MLEITAKFDEITLAELEGLENVIIDGDAQMILVYGGKDGDL